MTVTGRIAITSCMELCSSAVIINIAQRSGIYRLDIVCLISLFLKEIYGLSTNVVGSL